MVVMHYILWCKLREVIEMNEKIFAQMLIEVLNILEDEHLGMKDDTIDYLEKKYQVDFRNVIELANG